MFLHHTINKNYNGMCYKQNFKQFQFKQNEDPSVKTVEESIKSDIQLKPNLQIQCKKGP